MWRNNIRSFRERVFVGSVALWSLVLLPAATQAVPPPTYYNTVNTSSAAQLRSTLHAIIKDHTRFPYSSSGTDTWVILELADQDPANSANILDLYKNLSLVKFGGGTGAYNREHSWPNSYGFPTDGGTNYPYTDCHHLFLCDVGYNSDRGNQPYGACAPGATERTTAVNGGMGGGSGVFPGNSNWFNGSVWQTWNGRKGDVARAMFYMDVRYEGGNHGITGAAEPDLILTDNAALITTTGGNVTGAAYMGMLSTLIQWNAQDPPDNRERSRNDVVFGFQGNRNPFIDHPEWVNGIFVAATGPTITAITDVPADQGGFLQVSWQRNSLDAAGSVAPIAQYAIQRLQGSTWVDVTTQTATQSASYSKTISTADIAAPGNPTPTSQYRVAAVETGGFVRLSGTLGAYSIDNLAPPAPMAALNTGSAPWVLSWNAPGTADFSQACVYRGNTTGFAPGMSLSCTAGTSYLENDIATHYYVVQFSDIHGNLSSYSAEVGSVVSDVPVPNPLQTAITQVAPNPFNPTTQVSFALAQPGMVRIDVFTADGRLVRTLLNESRTAGEFSVLWNGRDGQGSHAANGPYLVRLQSGATVDTRKVTLVK